MSDERADSLWPRHKVETVPWQQSIRAGTREDRMMRSVDATIPPYIAGADFTPGLELVSAAENALVAIAQADTDAEGNSVALGQFMIRSESVASSKIERITASAEDYARATAGSRANPSALSMVAATTALHHLVDVVGERGRFALEDVLEAHRALMQDDPAEAAYAGRLRDMQNWVGGSDHSPRGALHVPPIPERVEPLIVDLLDYLNRDDVPVLIQATIAHAQFESIHPFTDGNGRIGRALVSASLRRRGVTKNTVIPIASGILARREEYFEALGLYRAGDPRPLARLFIRSAHVAALEARTSIARIKQLPQEWIDELQPQKGSAVATLLPAFFDHPAMNAEEIERHSGAKTVQTYAAIDQLVAAGVIREITGRKRNRVWVASDLLGELDDLDRRIQLAMR